MSPELLLEAVAKIKNPSADEWILVVSPSDHSPCTVPGKEALIRANKPGRCSCAATNKPVSLCLRSADVTQYELIKEMILEKYIKYTHTHARTHRATLPFDARIQVSIEVLYSCLIILNSSIRNNAHIEALKLILQTSQYTLYYIYISQRVFNLILTSSVMNVQACVQRALLSAKASVLLNIQHESLLQPIDTWIAWSNLTLWSLTTYIYIYTYVVPQR